MKTISLRKAIGNYICFKLLGEPCAYNWFRQKSIFFCPCKGAVHKIDIPESHLCLQWLIFFLPLFNVLLAYTPGSLWVKILVHFRARGLFSPILYQNIMDVVELGQCS